MDIRSSRGGYATVSALDAVRQEQASDLDESKLSGAAPIYAGRGRPDRLSGGSSGEDGLGKHA